jgi:hypothetical protein
MKVSGQCHAFHPRGRDPRYSLVRRLGGPQSRSGNRGYKKNPLPLPWIEPRLSTLKSDTILAEQPQLSETERETVP